MVGKQDYEDRKQSRIDRFSALAEKNEQKAKDDWNNFKTISDAIPAGQPILVGHHSEGRHRRDIKRMDNAMSKLSEHKNKAEYYNDRAEAAEENDTISSDDPEAIKKLKGKLARLEFQRENIKEYNKIARKSGTPPYEAYILQNLGQNIRSVKLRIESLEEIDKIEESKETINNITIEINKDENRVQMFFPGKPDKDTRTLLKSRGFHWSSYNGCWQRLISNQAIYQSKYIANYYKQ